MQSEPDVTRIVRSWLRTDEHESADRVLDIVLDVIDSTPQRRSWWPARRISEMNTFTKLAIGAAAVVLVAVVGIGLLPASGGVGGVPAISPSPAASTPSPATAPTPAPTAAAFAFPPGGELAIGRHDLTIDGVSLSLGVPASGWISNGTFAIDKGTFPATWDGGFIIWGSSADLVISDPCIRALGPRVGPSAADLAEAVANVPGTVVEGPSDVTVGGFPAKLVVVKILDVDACAAESFTRWWDGLRGPTTVLGSTIRVWIVDVDGTLIQFDGEIPKHAGPEVGLEMQQIVDSVRFE